MSAAASLWLAADRLDLDRARRAVFIGGAMLVLACGFGALHRLPRVEQSRSVSLDAPPPIGPEDEISRVWDYRNHLPQYMLLDARLEASKLPYVCALLLIVGCAFAVRRAQPGQSELEATGLGASSRTIV